jgi:Zn-dependent peptidase ImmA (M78 family)
MLANRNKLVSDIAADVPLSVDLSVLVAADTELPFEDLVALAKHFKRPWSYLLIDEAEVFDSAGQDNRSFSNQRRAPSPELMDEIEAVAEMLAAAVELFPSNRYEVPPAAITSDTSPEVAGAAIRDFLGITTDQQTRARDDFEALRLWVDALHARGVYVSQRRLQDETIRAFSRVEGEQAVVVVDTGDTPYARIFSLLHEYCHVILRSTGLCDLDDHSAVERHCNAAAAATLMPRALVTSIRAGRSFGVSPDADDSLLREMSSELRVSQAALLIRLRELGAIDQATYDDLEARRSARRVDESRTPGGTYYPPQINRIGRRYAHNVFGALDHGLINRQDASALLEVGEHLVATYRDELEGRAGRSR